MHTYVHWLTLYILSPHSKPPRIPTNLGVADKQSRTSTSLYSVKQEACQILKTYI